MPARDRILVVFDAHYCSNGNVVYAATRELVRQTGGVAQYRVFCKGRYRGPRFTSQLGDIRLISRRVVQPQDELEPESWLGSLRAWLRRPEEPSRWLTNLDPAERRLLRLLFEAERTHAVIVFTVDADFALRIARLVHVFADSTIPHIVVITPDSMANRDTLRDLRWLRAKVLQDGNVAPADESQAARKRTRRLTGAFRDDVPIKFDEGQPLSFLDAEFYPYQMAGVETTVAWSDWIGPIQPLPDRVRDVVLFIRPDWLNCGSGTLFESQARYFREGDGLLIDIGIWPYAVPFGRRERETKISEQQRHIRSALYFSLRRTRNVFYTLSQLRHLLRFWPRTVTNQILLQNAMATKPRLLREVVRRARLSHIYLNHYFTYLFAEDLIAGRKFFLDTHDIQAINVVHNDSRNLLSRRTDEFHSLLQEEMRILAKANRLGFVSQGELEIASRYIPSEKLEYIIPLPDIAPCAPKPLGKPPRLLIIAARNRGNERNLAWFLEQVWPKVIGATAGSGPSAAPQLDICGSIRTAFLNMRPPRVRFHGVVPDLRPFYERADIVLLPVITGGGVAIKTIEAVLHERPVVATQHALRGFPQAIVDTIEYTNQPKEYADAICHALASPQLMERRLERSRRAAQLLREQDFYERLAAVMDDVRVSEPVRRESAAHPAILEPRFLADPLGVRSRGIARMRELT